MEGENFARSQNVRQRRSTHEHSDKKHTHDHPHETLNKAKHIDISKNINLILFLFVLCVVFFLSIAYGELRGRVGELERQVISLSNKLEQRDYNQRKTANTDNTYDKIIISILTAMIILGNIVEILELLQMLELVILI